MTLFITLAIGAVIFCLGLFFHYIRRHPEALEDDKIESSKDYDSVLIQSFINARWSIQAEIREAVSKAVMEELYWEIERLEMDYKDAIPDQLLIVHIDELFSFHQFRAVQLKTLVFQ